LQEVPGIVQVIDFIRVLLLYFSTEIGDNNSMEMRNEIKVGDVVKSLDFVGVNNCYYVGLVTAVLSDGTFRATTLKRVWQGELQGKPSKIKFTETFVAPLPGHHFFDDLAETKGREPRVQVVA
jgi:hypothetical protein